MERDSREPEVVERRIRDFYPSEGGGSVRHRQPKLDSSLITYDGFDVDKVAVRLWPPSGPAATSAIVATLLQIIISSLLLNRDHLGRGLGGVANREHFVILLF